MLCSPAAVDPGLWISSMLEMLHLRGGAGRWARRMCRMLQRLTTCAVRILAPAEPLGFHHGRPVASLVVFRCCLQWKTFQAERTPLFDRIIAAMGSQVGAAALWQWPDDCIGISCE
jgi:hypothetical protein